MVATLSFGLAGLLVSHKFQHESMLTHKNRKKTQTKTVLYHPKLHSQLNKQTKKPTHSTASSILRAQRTSTISHHPLGHEYPVLHSS
jgi:hypothetical protein